MTEAEIRARLMELRAEAEEYSFPVEERIKRAVARAVTAEREACALAVEETDVVDFTFAGTLHDDGRKTLSAAAAAIRARGKEGT